MATLNRPAGLLRLLSLLVLLTGLVPANLGAQEATLEDYQKLRINEILASNDLVEPQNWRCRHVDMLEIYNGSDKDLDLDGALGTVRISDGSRMSDASDSPLRYLTFGRGHPVTRLPAGERLVVFCDEISDLQDRDEACRRLREELDLNEVHANFRLDAGGETLWIELLLDADPDNPVRLHEVTYPSLPEDVSFARFPETADNVDGFVFTSEPSFGECALPASFDLSSCQGAPNTGATPIRPDIELIDYITNAPAENEPVTFRVRLQDEVAPAEGNFQEVSIRFRVDGGEEQTVAMDFLGLFTDEANELEKWSIWEGDIPGQAAGSLVEFHFSTTDADDLVDTTPGSLCEYGTGPCDDDDPTGPGPGCDVTDDCNTPLRYVVGVETDSGLVVNEVVPNNFSIIEDPSEISRRCTFPNLNCRYDDFIELVNTTDAEIDLTGLVLARGPFRPERGWVFREDSRIAPGEHLLIWTDNDDRDPDPGDPDDPPNPNNPSIGAHHTSFSLDAGRDEIYLFRPVGEGESLRHRLIGGARWGVSGRYFTVSGPIADPVAEAVLPLLDRPASIGPYRGVGQDQSLARVPNAVSTSAFLLRDKADVTPGASNGGDIEPEFLFRRGDVNQDGVVDIADAVGNLTFQFLGGEAPSCLDALDVDDDGGLTINDPIYSLSFQFLGTDPIPAPGSDACGKDPTLDGFADEDCDYDSARCEAP